MNVAEDSCICCGAYVSVVEHTVIRLIFISINFNS